MTVVRWASSPWPIHNELERFTSEKGALGRNSSCMELREFAEKIVCSEGLAEKLTPPSCAPTDEDPGNARRMDGPGRVSTLRICPARDNRVPSIEGMQDPKQRAKIVHAFANHELQAVELFAWALLAFPDAPSEFRRGLLTILLDEQRHTRMYLARLADWGMSLGEYPLTGYFWNKVPGFHSPLRFICAMSLTFENANLDHTVNYSEAARSIGDPKTATIIEQVHKDEIRHVRFGWRWLHEFKEDDLDAWEAYCDNVTWPLRAALARSDPFHREGRREAGIDHDFIERLHASTSEDGKRREQEQAGEV